VNFSTFRLYSARQQTRGLNDLSSDFARRAHNTLIPFYEVPVFHKIKFTASRNSDKSEIVDSVQVRPAQTNSIHGRIIPAQITIITYYRLSRAYVIGPKLATIMDQSFHLFVFLVARPR
jgi:hypothetical protein